MYPRPSIKWTTPKLLKPKMCISITHSFRSRPISKTVNIVAWLQQQENSLWQYNKAFAVKALLEGTFITMHPSWKVYVETSVPFAWCRPPCRQRLLSLLGPVTVMKGWVGDVYRCGRHNAERSSEGPLYASPDRQPAPRRKHTIGAICEVLQNEKNRNSHSVIASK